MYSVLLVVHSLLRWLVLGFMLFAIYRAFTGMRQKLAFSKFDDSIRHWTATVSHIQLVVGIIMYLKSPLVKYFWNNREEAISDLDISFFSLFHPLVMIVAVVLLTVGSALAKRKPTDAEKFKTMLLWFSVVLLIVLAFIPWPFSPLANRPYLRMN